GLVRSVKKREGALKPGEAAKSGSHGAVSLLEEFTEIRSDHHSLRTDVPRLRAQCWTVRGIRNVDVLKPGAVQQKPASVERIAGQLETVPANNYPVRIDA